MGRGLLLGILGLAAECAPLGLWNECDSGTGVGKGLFGVDTDERIAGVPGLWAGVPGLEWVLELECFCALGIGVRLLGGTCR